MARKTTFHWNGATFQVAEDTVATGMDAEFVTYLLYPAPNLRQWRRGLEYGAFIAGVTITDGDPGFTIPSIDDEEAIRAFYEPFTDLPRDFRNALVNAKTDLLNQSLNAKDLTPGIDPNAIAPPTESGASNNSHEPTDSLSVLPAAVSE